MKVSKKDIDLRHQRIMEYLKEHRICETSALAEEFNISMPTVRRDIQELEAEGLVIRHHGSVQIARPFNENIPYEIYSTLNAREKERIVKYTAENLIQENDIVFINSSSTALMIYPYLNKSVTVVTNNAKVLQQKLMPEVHLILVGGELSSHNGEHILCGEYALSMISSITASVCILGTSGISALSGMSSSSPQDVSINKSMLRRTRGKKIIVADSSKIGKEFAFHYGDAGEITHLVTGSGSDTDELNMISQLGVSVQAV